MGVIFVTDPASGRSVPIQIDGDTPTQTEQDRINQWANSRLPQPSQGISGIQPPVEEEEGLGIIGGLGEFAQETAGGFANTLVQIPGGLAALGESLAGYTPGATKVGSTLGGFSDAGEDYIRGLTGEAEGWQGKAGQAVGSMGAFFVPGLGVARGAQALGAGVKTASALGGAAASVAGSGLGARDQLARIENQIAKGKKVSDEQIRKAVNIGGAIGLTEGIPVGLITGKVIGALRKVPVEAQEQALMTIGRRLRRAGTSALEEGGQEVLAGVLQDLTEQGIYNPDKKIGENAYDDGLYGGGAGGVLQFVLDTVGGRRVRRGTEFRQDYEEELGEGETMRQRAEDALAQGERQEEAETRRAAYNAMQTPLDETEGAPAQALPQPRADYKALNKTVASQIKRREQAQEPSPQDAVKAERDSRVSAMREAEQAERVEQLKQSGLALEEAARAEQAEAETDIQAMERVPILSRGRQQKAAEITEDTVEAEKKSRDRTKIGQAVTQQMRKEGMDGKKAKELGGDVAEVAEPEETPGIKRRIIRPNKAEEQFGIPYTVHEFETPGGTYYASRSNSTGGSSFAGEFDVWKKGDNPGNSQWMGRTLKDVEANLSEIVQPDKKKGKTPRKRSETPVAVARKAKKSPVRKELPTDRQGLSDVLDHRLKKIGINDDVRLRLRQVLEPNALDKGVVKGYTEGDGDGKMVIALASEIYSEGEIDQRTLETLNHEIIHALRSLGKITPAEWKTLVKAANKQKRIKGRKKRSYTYLEWEAGKNRLLAPDQRLSDEAVMEEAVAEMFRDYAAGRLRIAGRPKSIFDKIIEFIRTLGGVLSDRNIRGAKDIFEGIEGGQIGAREGGVPRPLDRRYSRVNVDPRQMFYSPLLKAADEASQKASPPEQWLSYLSKRPGVKPAEIEWTGLPEWLSAQEGKVSKEDLINFLDKSKISVITNFRQEDGGGLRIIEGDDVDPDWSYEAEAYEDYAREYIIEREGDEYEPSEEEIHDEAMSMAEAYYTPSERYIDIYDEGAGEVIASGFMSIDEGIYYIDGREFLHEEDVIAHYAPPEGGDDQIVTDSPEHETYTIGGGSNYREILLRIPDLHKVGPNADRHAHRKKEINERLSELTQISVERADADQRRFDYRPGRSVFSYLTPDEQGEYRRLSDEHDDISMDASKVPFVESAHFGEENIVVHARVKDRTDLDGNKILFVDEVQSDLSSQWREERRNNNRSNSPTRTPITPFEGEKAYNLMSKRLLRLAAHEGYDAVAWTPGYLQAERWSAAASSVVNDIKWNDAGSGERNVALTMSGGNPFMVKVSHEGNVSEILTPVNNDVEQAVFGKSLKSLLGGQIASQIMESSEGEINDAEIIFDSSGYAIAYDKQLKNSFEKMVKKVGGKVQVNKSLKDLGAEPARYVYKNGIDQAAISADVDKLIDIYKEAFKSSEEDIVTHRNDARAEQESMRKGWIDAINYYRESISDPDAPKLDEGFAETKIYDYEGKLSKTSDPDMKFKLEVLSHLDKYKGLNWVQPKYPELFDGTDPVEGRPVWYVKLDGKIKDMALEPMPILQTPVADVQGLTREAAEKALPRLRYDLDRMGLKDVRVGLDEKGMTHQGRFIPGEQLTILIAETIDPTKTIHHEAIHAMRELGMLSPEEWQVLTRAAETKWINEYDIPNRYPGLSRGEHIEEAIAEAFGDYASNRQADKGAVGKVMEKIAKIIDAIKSAFRGISPEQIFSDAYDGTVAARRPFSLRPDNIKSEMDVAFSRRKAQPKPQPFLRQYSRGTPSNPNLTPERLNDMDISKSYANVSRLIGRGLGMVMEEDKATKMGQLFVMKFQDRMEPVGRVIDDLRKMGADINDMLDAYREEEVMHGIVGNAARIADETLYSPAIDVLADVNLTTSQSDDLARVSGYFRQHRQKFIKDGTVLNRIRNRHRTDRLAMGDAYLYAMHAKERNEFVRRITDGANKEGSGMSNAEASAIITWVRDNGLEGKMEMFRQNVRKIVDDTNDVRLRGGLISEEMAETQTHNGAVSADNRNFINYVPLRGKKGDDPELQEYSWRPSGRVFAGALGREDPSITGRSGYADGSILGNTMIQHQQSIIRAARNKVGQTFANMARQEKDRLEELKSAVEIKDKVPMKKAVSKTGQVILTPDFKFADDPRVVPFKEGGKQKYMVVQDLLMARALKGSMSSDKLSSGLRFINKITRTLANLNTSWNPEFMLSNFPRDAETALVNATQYDIEGLRKDIYRGLKPGGGVWSTLNGFYMKKRRAKDFPDDENLALYERYMASGGKNMLNQMSDIYDLEDQLNGTLRKIGEFDASGKDAAALIMEKGGEGIKSLFDIIENYNDIVENATRFSFFRALVERGVSDKQAAQAARNLTTNFAKGGELKTPMNALYLFYNASLQGSMALANAAIRSPRVRKLWGGMIMYGLMQDMIMSAISDEDEDGRLHYDQIHEYTLQHNLIFMIPGGEGAVKIPLGYGLNMAVNAGRVIGRMMRGQYTPEQAAYSIFDTVVETFNPLGDSESAYNLVGPTVADPFVDILENENFRNQPIYKTAFPNQYIADSHNHWTTTSPSFVNFAQKVNKLTGGTDVESGSILGLDTDWSPDILEYWFDFLTGATGATVMRAAELPWSVAGPAMRGVFEEDMWREVPVARKVYEKPSTRSKAGDFFEKFDRIKEKRAELNAALEAKDRDRIKRARETGRDMIRLYDRINDIDQQRRKLEEQKRRIQEKDMLQDEKDRRVRVLNERIDKLINRGNKLMRDI